MTDLAFDFRDIVHQSQDAICIIRAFPLHAPGPEVVFVNDAYSRQTGISAEECIGKSPLSLQASASGDDSSAKIRQALEHRQTTQLILNKHNKMGEEYWVELNIQPLKNKHNEVTHFALVERDVSERKLLQQMLDESPRKDSLTGLLNRGAFDEALLREFSLYTRTQNEYSILLIDIDNFKSIDKVQNRDMLLQDLASTFEIIFRSYDQVARTGEDQFCILLRQTTMEQAFISAIRFRQTVQKRAFSIEGDSINITVSIGVSRVLPDDSGYTDGLQRADEAMQQAKHNGGDQVQLCKKKVRASI